MSNETAYEEHRSWRRKGQYSLASFLRRNAESPLLGSSWACRVCKWAKDSAQVHHKRRRNCAKERSDDDENRTGGHDAYERVDAAYYNGRAVRGAGREVYLVENAKLRLIPSLDTFFCSKLKSCGRYPIRGSGIQADPHWQVFALSGSKVVHCIVS